MGLRVNLLCLLGACLGLVCLAFPLLTVTFTDYHRPGAPTTERVLYMSSNQLAGTWMDPPILQHADWLIAFIAFFGGALLAFGTPLGGAGMAAGLLEYYIALGDEFDAIAARLSHLSFVVTSVGWDAAFYMGILATALVLMSAILPVGPGYSEMYEKWPFRGWHLRKRLLVWGIRGRK